jgi:adenine phosphoribosyltransferase
MLERLRKSLETAPIVRRGDYDYFIHPMTDGVPRMDPMVLAETLDAIKEVGNFHCDVILAPEAMAIPLVVPLSLELGIPYTVIRKRHYGLPGELEIKQRTGYSRKEMFINDIKRGDRVVVIDDVMSTGGTIKAVVLGLQEIGAEVVDVIVVVEKGDKKEEIEKELGIGIKTLVKVKVSDGKLVVLN